MITSQVVCTYVSSEWIEFNKHITKTETFHQSSELWTTDVPHIPRLYEEYNCTISIPQPGYSDDTWYYALTNGGSLSSVWDLCQARYVDTGNRSLWMGWTLTQYYDNKTVFPIDATDGMVECWYNDRIHGLIKTDYHNSYGQNDIIPTPSNETGILLTLRNDLFDYSDALTTINNGDVSCIRLDGDDIITIDDALNVWQNDICKPMVADYCEWVDVPPYFCKKYINKSWMEAIALSLAPTSTVYSALLITFLFLMKCKAHASKESDVLQEFDVITYKSTNQTEENRTDSVV